MGRYGYQTVCIAMDVWPLAWSEELLSPSLDIEGGERSEPKL